MDYSESFPDFITLSEALFEINKHDVCLHEFFTDCGIKQHYAADTILIWLGY